MVDPVSGRAYPGPIPRSPRPVARDAFGREGQGGRDGAPGRDGAVGAEDGPGRGSAPGGFGGPSFASYLSQGPRQAPRQGPGLGQGPGPTYDGAFGDAGPGRAAGLGRGAGDRDGYGRELPARDGLGRDIHAPRHLADNWEGPVNLNLNRPLPSRRHGLHWLLAIPIIPPLLVPVYNRINPRLFGVPFFYWYQLACVVLAIAIIGLVYQLTKGRRPRWPR